MKRITLLTLKHSNFWREDGKHISLHSNQWSILHHKLRKNQNHVYENIIFLSRENVLSVLFREEFSIMPHVFLFQLWFFIVGLWNMLRYSSNYYYNLHVFLKLKAGIFCVEPEYLRSEMVQIIKHGKNISLGNITDNVVMTSGGHLKHHLWKLRWSLNHFQWVIVRTRILELIYTSDDYGWNPACPPLNICHYSL